MGAGQVEAGQVGAQQVGARQVGARQVGYFEIWVIFYNRKCTEYFRLSADRLSAAAGDFQTPERLKRLYFNSN